MSDRTTKVTLAAEVNGFLSSIQRAEKATEKLGSASAEAAAKLEKQNQAMRTVGAGLLVAGTVAVAATALAVKAAIDWETAWAGVTKTVDGTPAQMAELEDSLRSLAKTLPATHTEIAAVTEAAGQLGVQRENIAAFTKTMIDLGETTNLSADEAATSIAKLMNVMGTAPDQVDNLGSALVALGNDGASTERDIVQMAQRIAGAGRIVGLTEGEVLGFANALASVGIEAEAGGSAVSRIMTDIAISVSTGGEELEKFASVAGLSSTEFQKAFNEDPADAIATFVEGLGRIDAAGGDVFSTLADLGQSDIRVSQALLGMANSGDLLRKSLNLGNDALEENTALAEEAAKRYETTAAKLAIVGNKINDAAIVFGDMFLPAVTAVAEAVGALADGFGSLGEPNRIVIAGMVTLTAVAGVAGGALLLMVPKIAELRIALGVLSASSIPAVAASAAGMTAAMGKATAAAGAAARFLTGPWGLAIAAAAVGVGALHQVLKSLEATAEEMENSIVTASNASDILRTAFEGTPDGFWFDDGARSIDAFRHRLELLQKMDDNLWEKLLPGNQAETSDFAVGIDKIGKSLAQVAAKDLPAAQSAFRSLVEQYDLTAAEQENLLNRMPAYKAALTDQASASGIAADGANLLELAMGNSAGSSESAAAGYKAAADEAQGLSDQVTTLLEAINEANGVGQDAVSANANYQAALAGITEEVDRQKEAFIQLQRDAYEAANGSLDGFVGTLDGFALSLDEGTSAGSANAAMLADVASKAQASALATLELETRTLGSKTATDNYAATLAEQRQAFIDSAVGAGYNAAEVQKLADKVFAMPTKRELEIIAKTAAAQAAIDNFIYNNDGRRISVIVDGVSGRQVQGVNMVAVATGGHVTGPGTGTSDSIPAMLSNGEFVINAAATRRNLALLHEINRGGLRGYAAGGYVQPQYASHYGGGASVQMPSMDGLSITGRLEIGGDGLARIIDGRIVQNSTDRTRRFEAGRRQ